MKKIRAAVVGLGYWGPNLARNLQSIGQFELVGLCDREPERLARVQSTFPWARPFEAFSAMLTETQPELVAIATPVAHHYELARQALEAGAHVLCEKPMTGTLREAEALIQLATERKRHLFVDHTFVYTSAVRRLKDILASGRLGELLYVDSVRINLGLFQPDVDVVWDLCPHDLSILGYVLGRDPIAVRAHGTCHNPRGFADVAYVSLEYEGALTAHLHLSWLSPVKVRRMIFPGTSASLIYDELEPSEKVKLYEHGFSFESADTEAKQNLQVKYRRGDMLAPALDAVEALRAEVQEIAACLRGGPEPPGHARAGLGVVRTLEGISRSIAAGGERVAL
jgi:predicted dehydrogenase